MRKQNFFQKGFTLIELLVVIAIIGILAAVVLASLSSARQKGKEAKVQSEMASLRSQAEIYRSAHNKYTSMCTASTTDGIYDRVLSIAQVVAPSTTSVTGGNQGVGATARAACHNAADTWAASVPFKVNANENPTTYWCVDSNGASRQVTGKLLSGVLECPAS